MKGIFNVEGESVNSLSYIFAIDVKRYFACSSEFETIPENFPAGKTSRLKHRAFYSHVRAPI